MSNDTLRADQIAFHFYTKLFYIVNQARATETPPSSQKVDKWFNLETPDSDLFSKEEREPYRAVSLAPFPGPPTLELDVLLAIPELTNNQVLVYMPPDSSRVRIEPTPKFILLETWSLGMTFHRPGSASDQHRDTSPDVALPIIYKHGIILFRSVYSLLRVLPAWKFYQRLKRKISGFNGKGNLGIRLRVRNPGESETDTHILGFNARLSPTYRQPLPTSRHDFQAVPHLLGSFTLSTTYLTTPNFQLDELESILSSKFLSLDLEGFVPTLDKNRQRDSLIGSSLPNSGLRSILSRSPPRAVGRVLSSGNGGASVATDNFSIADRFILPSRIQSMGTQPPSLGMTASSGTSALIPPPRPFPTMNNSNNNPNTNPPSSPLIATSPFSIPSPVHPTHPINRLRKESLNSISSSSSISTRDAPHGQYSITNTTSPSTHTNPNPNNIHSLSTSPVTAGALPIRRPTINPVHPFKSSTFSSTSGSGSSPSLSIRQGGSGGGVGGGAVSPVGVPSSLSGNTNTGGVGVGAAGGGATGTRPASPSPHTHTQTHGAHSRQPSSASPIGAAGTLPGRLPPSPSSLGDRDRDRDRRPGTSGSGGSDREKEREWDRRVSVGSGSGSGSGSGVGGGTGTGTEEPQEGRGGVVPMNMPPPRKRYSSSFGHRYGGSAGSATGMGVGVGVGGGVQVGSVGSSAGAGGGGGGGGAGGGNEGKSPGGVGGGTPGSGRNTPASLGTGPGGKEGNPSFLGEGTTDDDEISIFVQDIDSRKPLSGRVKEREKRDREREREREELERLERDDDRGDWRYDQRAHGHEPRRDEESGQAKVKGKGKEREREREDGPPQHPRTQSQPQWDDWHQPQPQPLPHPLSSRRRSQFDDDAMYGPAGVTTDSPSAAPDSCERETERERTAQMSISPTRGGPMLTSQNEVEERLKKMNEAFFKSLEGLSTGSVRRKDRQKEKDSAKEKEKDGSSGGGGGRTTTPSSGSGSGSDNRERGGMGSTGNTSRAPHGYGLGVGRVGFPSRGEGGGGSDPSRMDYPSSSPYLYNSPASGGMAPGLGHGLLERGRYSSTSSSTLATSEIGTSQGSEEVIGRLDLYDEPSLRRRRG